MGDLAVEEAAEEDTEKALALVAAEKRAAVEAETVAPAALPVSPVADWLAAWAPARDRDPARARKVKTMKVRQRPLLVPSPSAGFLR